MELRIFILCLLALTIKAQTDFEKEVYIPCVSNDTCKKSNSQAICHSNRCLCPIQGGWENCPFIKDDFVGDMPRETDLRCERDEDCRFINNTHCLPTHLGDITFKMCQCDADMVMNSNATKCLKTAYGTGAECSELIQCTTVLGNSSECMGGKCRCKPGYHYVGETKDHCVANKGYMEKCTREEQSCYQPNPDATINVLGCSTKGFCKCIKNYAFIDGLCRSSDASLIAPQVLISTILIAIATRFF